jgi:hypothetical protein
MIVRRWFIILIALMALSGCGLTGSNSFRNMSTAYREVLEDYSNNNMLLNIVRSSESMPMSFLDMPNVIGSGLLQSSAIVTGTIMGAAPSTPLGFISPATGSSYGPTLGLTANAGFTFTQSSLDNSAFMTAFLSRLKPEALQSLIDISTGPKEILYTLTVDTIEVYDLATNRVKELFVNNPLLPEYPKFQEILYELIKHGLSTETVAERVPMSPVMSHETVKDNVRALVEAAAHPGIMLLPAKLPNGQPGQQLARMIAMTRMCLVRHQDKPVERAALEQKFSSGAFCASEVPGATPGSSDTTKTPEQIKSDSKKLALIIKLRSTRKIFDFLGTLMSMQLGPEKKYVTLKASSALDLSTPSQPVQAATPNYDFPLFVIQKNNTQDAALATVNYRGNAYSIPETNSGASRQVLVALSQILTLNKVPGSIPSSPAVLIK